MIFALPFPMIDPVAISIGPLDIRWYSLAYIAGFLFGWWYVKKLFDTYHPQLLTKALMEQLMTYLILGVIIGGRLGYVLFYNFPEKIWHIFYIWQGGMSFHGGAIGITLAALLFCHKNNFPFLRLADFVCCAAPIGLFLGRIANFINGELYGRTTDSPLGMVFPQGGPLPRHPSQIYEALGEGLLLFIILYLIRRFVPIIRDHHGRLFGVFLIYYASFRIFVEQFREPDHQLGFIISSFTMGQILSLPMVILGLWLLLRTPCRS